MKRIFSAVMSVVILTFYMLSFERDVLAASINATNLTLYALEDGYAQYISIPDNMPQQYQLKVSGAAGTPSYKVIKGDSVTVDGNGLVKPKQQIWYWNGGIGSTVSSGAPGEVVEISYNFGTSVVRVSVDGSYYDVTVEVENYAKFYAESVMNTYLEQNVSENMTAYEKLNEICKFVAGYDYSVFASGYTGMLVTGGGDCWASCAVILYMCEKIGIPAHLRYAVNDAGAGSGHRNVAVLIDGEVYIAEAGYSGTAPRHYSISKNGPWTCKTVTADTVCITQYDGFDLDVVVPETIQGYTVTEIGKSAFWNGYNYSGVELTSVTLPATIEKINDFAFSGCQSLTNIQVSPQNKVYSSLDGVLYNKNKTVLVAYPAGKTGSFDIPGTVRELAAYSIYYGDGITKLSVPASVSKIGEGAIARCLNLKEIYFSGNLPAIEDYVLREDILNAYYPAGNPTWTNEATKAFEGNIVWASWEVPAPPRTPGDVDEDGFVTSSDVVLLMQYLAEMTNLPVQPNLKNADVNNDGETNSSDVVLLMQYLAEMDVVLQ